MHSEIEKLIAMALADGQLSDKEREILLRKAEKLGLDLDEVEMYIEGEISANNTKSKDDKEIFNINQNSSQVNEKLQPRGYTPKKINHLKPAILDKEVGLNLANEDLNKNNSILFKKINNLYGKIKVHYDFLLTEKIKVDKQTKIIEAKYNDTSKLYIDEFINDINLQVSNKFGQTKLIINSQNKIIGLNPDEIISLIKNEGKWDSSILNHKYDKKRIFFNKLIFFGIILIIWINSTSPYTFREIGIEKKWVGFIAFVFTVVVGLNATNYSKLIKNNKMNFSFEEIIPVLNEIIKKYENKFTELIDLKQELNEIEILKNKLEQINISDCEKILKLNY